LVTQLASGQAVVSYPKKRYERFTQGAADMKSERRLHRRQFLGEGMAISSALVGGSGDARRGEIDQDLAQRTIRVGVIGCGSVSRVYLPHLSSCRFIELVSTCDKIPERAQIAAANFRVANHYSHIEAMLAGAPFDLMLNLTDMQEHGRLNKIALEAGRHVWSEKPLANTYAEGRVLLELANQKKVRIWGAPAVVTSPQSRGG
jgi:Oxidoreductase family, NAD-binding Rossmann fold